VEGRHMKSHMEANFRGYNSERFFNKQVEERTILKRLI
jgi:hypothetical protein